VIHATRAPGQWAEWISGRAPYTVGLEEEVMLLDPQRGWGLAQRIEDALQALPSDMSGHVSAETHQAAIELMTDPHESVVDAVTQLGRLRRGLAATLGELGLAAGVAGTHPWADWSETEVTPASRYQLIRETMRGLTAREPTFALHVHIGVPDPEQAIELYNRMRAHLPMLLALSSNSPFWRGQDAGFASTRTFLFQAFPRTGMPRRYGSYDEWVEAVDLQIRAGALPEATFLWWDVRLQPRFGTIEIRVMDAQTSLADTAALLALVQSIARLELEEGYVAEHLIRAEEVLEENRFIAARDGVHAHLIDTTEESLRSVSELLAQLLDAAGPHATELGCRAQLDEMTTLLANSGAVRQRACAADPSGLVRLVEGLSAQFIDEERC
jgi:carboxylate-amine ligase